MRKYHLTKFSDKPAGRIKLCQRMTPETDLVQIALFQRGVDRFAVQYGMQVDDDLTYDRAALALGAALMHALACEGVLDNRERGER